MRILISSQSNDIVDIFFSLECVKIVFDFNSPWEPINIILEEVREYFFSYHSFNIFFIFAFHHYQILANDATDLKSIEERFHFQNSFAPELSETTVTHSFPRVVVERNSRSVFISFSGMISVLAVFK